MKIQMKGRVRSCRGVEGKSMRRNVEQIGFPGGSEDRSDHVTRNPGKGDRVRKNERRGRWSR